jgi:hypothetical protein
MKILKITILILLIHLIKMLWHTINLDGGQKVDQTSL